MNNKSLCRAIAAFDDAGLDVVRFEPEGSMALFSIADNGRNPVDYGRRVSPLSQRSIERKFENRTAKENCDLVRYLGASDWRHALGLVQEIIRERKDENILNIGDFMHVSFDVPAADYLGLSFKELVIKDAKVQIVEIMNNKVIFNFDEIIFRSAINSHDSGNGSFSDSALAEYLGNEFYEAMDISAYTFASKDGNFITLLTAFELFGQSEYWEKETNWDALDKEVYMQQMAYFQNEKNRVKVYKNETSWYWTSSPRASVASHFCLVSGNGSSGNHAASEVRGVAPAFCVA